MPTDMKTTEADVAIAGGGPFGLGYNTAVEDAVNLGWKLAAN